MSKLNSKKNYSYRLETYSPNVQAFHNLTAGFAGAYMTASQAIDYFNLVNFPDVNILKTKQYIQMTPVSIHYQKHSCLLKPFDRQISLYKAYGFIEYWSRKYKHSAVHETVSTEPKTLSFDQISGVLIVCFFLLLASMILFFLELISVYCKRIRMLLDFLTFNANYKQSFLITQPFTTTIWRP